MDKIKQVGKEITLSLPKDPGSVRLALDEARRGMPQLAELMEEGERLDFEVSKVEPDPSRADRVLITVRADVRREV